MWRRFILMLQTLWARVVRMRRRQVAVAPSTPQPTATADVASTEPERQRPAPAPFLDLKAMPTVGFQRSDGRTVCIVAPGTRIRHSDRTYRVRWDGAWVRIMEVLTGALA